MAAGVLAMSGAAAHDTSLRVPGTSLRFGATLAQVQRVIRQQGAPKVTFPPATPPAPGIVTWPTGLRFYGLAGAATLEFKDSLLVRASVVVDHPSSHEMDYVEDDLVRQGFRRQCVVRADPIRNCEWTGRVRVHLSTSETSLEATLEPPAKPALADSVSAAAAAPPETLQLSLAPAAATAPDSLPWAVVVDSCQAIRPDIARQSGVFGRVLVEATVDTTGQVSAARIARGVPMLDEAALACTRRYRFAPCVWRGRPRPFRVTLPIRFTL